VPSDLLRLYVPGSTFAEAFPRLRETYCGTIAYQVEHISSHEQRLWLRRAIEGGAAKERLPEEERIRLLERLVALDHFERFLQRAYVGQKTFSIEGVDALVPMLDLTIELCSEAGAGEIVIGMAHRGRLNVITNVIGRPVESILAEFEGHADVDPDAEEEALETAGDVKYHLGAEGTYVTTAGRPIAVTLAANPSHLEQVNAVVEGGTRARQTVRKSREALVDPNRAVAVLVHGDAAFPGQGAVAETLNLSGLAGYSTGGTVHIIANNQIGFTTDPQDGRSTYYASDLAKGFDIPIIHVNADDVEACLEAVRLAVAFRNKFHRDVLIDLIGYRRHGHNEADEPAYTQPVMSMTIKEHPRAYEIYAQKLIGEAVVSSERVAQMEAEVNGRLAEARSSLTRLIEQTTTEDGADGGSEPQGHASPPQILHSDIRTAVSAEVLRSLNEELLTVPEGFTIHPKLRPQLERRRAAMGEDGGILWAHAEALAFASLLSDGVPIRLTGQDTQRGTFSQRHLELHDAGTDQSWMPYTGRTYVPMAHLSKATASFELYNSPLSESAAVGFEYGYSTLAPDALVLWEAQYGDFANGAQIIIDQFISSGRAKWGERSRLALLLPHGYEGSGPEHSSARIERFLQLSAEDNLRIAYPSTAAQYFHLLRRQGLLDEFRPLVVFTPKSLLRSREAASHIEDLAQGRFEPVLDDPAVADRRERVTRILFCTGKIAHELATAPARADAGDLAIVRVELLFPFPEMAAREVIARYPKLRQATWVQEEPRNMGAWDAMYRNIPRLLPEGATFEYLGRSPRSSPAEGYPQAHRAEQQRLLERAFARDRGDG
jgi:multifunctional 2-oxoglutarate metabolism enzyme